MLIHSTRLIFDLLIASYLLDLAYMCYKIDKLACLCVCVCNSTRVCVCVCLFRSCYVLI